MAGRDEKSTGKKTEGLTTKQENTRREPIGPVHNCDGEEGGQRVLGPETLTP